MEDKVTHEHILERIDSVQRELTEAKRDSKDHREKLQERLRAIEQKLAALGGGWKVLAMLGGILAGTVALVASILATIKGLK